MTNFNLYERYSRSKHVKKCFYRSSYFYVNTVNGNYFVIKNEGDGGVSQLFHRFYVKHYKRPTVKHIPLAAGPLYICVQELDKVLPLPNLQTQSV